MKKHAKSLIGIVRDHYGDLKTIRGAEVGVWRGELSETLLRAFPRLTLWMVDPWEKLLQGTPTMKKDVDEVIEARLEADRRTQFMKRVIVQNTSVDAARHCSHDFHFVFIDACHLYESVRGDIEAWLPLVVPNGIICGHDYDGVGDHRCGWGVKKAVDEWFGDRVQVAPGNVWWMVKCR